MPDRYRSYWWVNNRWWIVSNTYFFIDLLRTQNTLNCHFATHHRQAIFEYTLTHWGIIISVKIYLQKQFDFSKIKVCSWSPFFGLLVNICVCEYDNKQKEKMNSMYTMTDGINSVWHVKKKTWDRKSTEIRESCWGRKYIDLLSSYTWKSRIQINKYCTPVYLKFEVTKIHGIGFTKSVHIPIW